MHSFVKWIFGITIIVAALVSSNVSAQGLSRSNLQCYDCTSKGCTDTKYCGPNQYCLKATITHSNGATSYNKQCVPNILDCKKYQKDMADKNIVVSDCKTCNYNFCNMSSLTNPSVFALISLAMISICFQILF